MRPSSHRLVEVGAVGDVQRLARSAWTRRSAAASMVVDIVASHHSMGRTWRIPVAGSRWRTRMARSAGRRPGLAVPTMTPAVPALLRRQSRWGFAGIPPTSSRTTRRQSSGPPRSPPVPRCDASSFWRSDAWWGWRRGRCGGRSKVRACSTMSVSASSTSRSGGVMADGIRSDTTRLVSHWSRSTSVRGRRGSRASLGRKSIRRVGWCRETLRRRAPPHERRAQAVGRTVRVDGVRRRGLGGRRRDRGRGARYALQARPARRRAGRRDRRAPSRCSRGRRT